MRAPIRRRGGSPGGTLWRMVSWRKRRTDVSSSRLVWRDLAAEAIAGVTQRPGRAALTMLGTILGVGAFVAVLGFTATASAQIGQQFNALSATTVTVTDAGGVQAGDAGMSATTMDFPPDADQRIDRLNGVVSAGVWWQVNFGIAPVISAVPGAIQGSDADLGEDAKVYAASPGLFGAMKATLSVGVFFNRFHDTRTQPVAVIGAGIANRLGIARIDAQPAVFINGQPFTIIGIVKSIATNPEMLLGIIIPQRTVLRLYGPPLSSAAAQMLIRTRLGAAQLIAAQAPLALSPNNPGLLAAIPPANPRGLRQAISTDLTGLFMALAAICLVIGAVGIANTTFVAVLERTGEIGLRRALGALRWHIAAQFLAESTMLGLLGGMVGTALAVSGVVIFAAIREWTAVLNPVTAVAAPLVGAGIGLIAGLYPALHAALIEPLDALRR